jgi:anaerobic magnesium-protoporphyrin IX monomethyl ester cyclase
LHLYIDEATTLSRSRKIVFFFPSFASTEATAPLGILAVSTPLERAGYSICLIDSTITPNFEERVLEEVKDALCLGISLVTGPMIRETVAIAKAVKAWNPDFPIILGGWHPSLLPDQTLEAPYVGKAKSRYWNLYNTSPAARLRISFQASD